MNTQLLMVENQKYNQYRKSINEILELSIKGLEDLYIADTYEFALKKKLICKNVEVNGTNLRYTLINLLGLYKAECNGFKIKFDLKKILKHQINNPNVYTGVGEIGLLLWAAALISPEEIDNIITKVNFTDILTTYKDAKMGLTNELSWLLIGVLISSTFNSDFKSLVGNLPNDIYNLLRKNYGGFGIFQHQSSENIKGLFRGKIASFADQVYPIFALTLYSQIQKSREAKLIVQECALKICEHQGENGEWMWHYDSRDGKVISKYPVYSVHQDAMAPIALFAAQKVTGINFEPNVYKGLSWLTNNSLDLNMIDFENNMIYRAIEPRKVHRKIKSTLNHLGFETGEEYDNIEVSRESWSYHFGWILFAFAGRVNLPKTESQNKELIDLREFNRDIVASKLQ